MARVSSFPPVEAPDARVLILGSMPGEASLRAGEYYAHPRNAFWRIMAEFTGVSPEADYARRVAGLSRAGIALWDVLKSCERKGSLDAAIKNHSIVPNDFPGLLVRHSRLSMVCFNGSKAEAAFRRYVLRACEPEFRYLAFRRLPSTSPAHAALSPEQKLDVWREVLQQVV
jgi:double-stranded uracil-DNA glycosylase